MICRFFFAVVLASVCLASEGRAGVVLVQGTGTVSSVDTALLSKFSVGEPVQISFTYDTSVPSTGGPVVFNYANAMHSLVVNMGDDTFTKSSAALSIANNAPFDEFLLSFVPVNGPAIAGLNPPDFTFGLVAPDTLLSNGSLPSPLPNLASWSHLTNVFVSYHDPGPNFDNRAYINLTSLTSTIAIPEASALILPGCAIILLIGSSAFRRTRQSKPSGNLS